MGQPSFGGIRVPFLARAATVVAVAASTLMAGTSDAQGDHTQDLDVVFVVDQSGSMGGRAYGSVAHPNANDPLGLRFDLQERFIDLLGSDRLQRHTDARYRVAIVSFGSKAPEDTVPFVSITPGNPAEWARLQADLNGRVSRTHWQGRNLGDTDFLLAFRQAHRLFQQLPDDGARRAIVVVTDGGPYVEGRTQTSAQQSDHMRQLIDFVQTDLPPDRYAIFVVALDAPNEYWPSFGRSWEELAAGRSRRVESPAEAGQYLVRIFNELILCEPPQCRPLRPGQVAVPPYLQSIHFDFFRNRPTDTFQVTCEGCPQPFQPNDDEGKGPVVRAQRVGGALETLSVDNPPPGIWNLQVRGEGEPRVFLRQVEVRCAATKFPTGVVYQFAPQSVELQCLDGSGRPIRIYPEPYRLDLAATLEVSNQTVPLALGARGGGFSAIFRPDTLGPYVGQVVAKSKTYQEAPEGGRFELKDYVLYQQEVGRFDVRESVLLRGALAVQPLAQGHSPVYAGFGALSPLVIEAGLVDRAGQPVDPAQVVQGLVDPLFELRLRGQGTGDRSSEVNLLPVAGSAGRYRGELALEEPDTYDLELGLAAQLKPGYAYDYPPTEHLVRFADPAALLLRWELHHGPGIGLWLLALLILAGTAVVGSRRWWFERRPPLLQGHLQVMARSTLQNRVLQELRLGVGRNRLHFGRLEPRTRLGGIAARCGTRTASAEPAVEVDVWDARSRVPARLLGMAMALGSGAVVAAAVLLFPLESWPLTLGMHLLGLLVVAGAIGLIWSRVVFDFMADRGTPLVAGRRLHLGDELAIPTAAVGVRYRR